MRPLAGRLETASGPERARIKGELLASARLIGLLQADPEAWFQGAADPALKARVEALLSERTAARAARDWAKADEIRDKLNALNIEVMDGPAGVTWRIKERV